jgi:uncharacterized membrane protein YjjP (DUF1212 family)
MTRIPRLVVVGNILAIPLYSLMAASPVDFTGIGESYRWYVSIAVGTVAAIIAIVAWRFGPVAGSVTQIALFSPMIIALSLAVRGGSWTISDLRDLRDPRVMAAIFVEVLVPGVLLFVAVRALVLKRPTKRS